MTAALRRFGGPIQWASSSSWFSYLRVFPIACRAPKRKKTWLHRFVFALASREESESSPSVLVFGRARLCTPFGGANDGGQVDDRTINSGRKQIFLTCSSFAILRIRTSAAVAPIS